MTGNTTATVRSLLALQSGRHPELDVITMASRSPQNVAQLHHWIIELTRKASRDEVLAAFL